jgi:hypothetical protein
MKRLFAIAGVFGLFLAMAPPAAAQGAPTARLSGVGNGGTYSGHVRILAEGSSSIGIKRLEISINGTVVRSENYGGVQGNADIDFTWATDRAAPVGGRNTHYTVRVRAINNNNAEAVQEARVAVENGTSAPRGVSASFDSNSVGIGWASNPEADITGYRVERDSGSGWSSIGTTGSTSMSDSPGPGNHSYRVIAIRSSVVNGGGTASGPSSPASVNVPAPPPSSSGGAAPGSGSGSGSGSGTGSGSTGSGKGGSAGGSGSGGNSGGIPGYGGRKGKAGSGSGSGGGGRSRGGSVYGTYGSASGRRLGAIGLPGRLSLPGRMGVGRAQIQELGADRPEWGSFEENLPYNLEGGFEVEEALGSPRRVAALSPYRAIPPDGLRWVAAGLWLIVTAAFLKALERLITQKELAAAAALAAREVPEITEDMIPLEVLAAAHEEVAVPERIPLVAVQEPKVPVAEVSGIREPVLAEAEVSPAATAVVEDEAIAPAAQASSSPAPTRAAASSKVKKATSASKKPRSRTETARTTAKKTRSNAAKGSAPKNAGTKGAAKSPAKAADRSSKKTTTARKSSTRTPGAKRRSTARKTTTSQPKLRLVKNDSAAA